MNVEVVCPRCSTRHHETDHTDTVRSAYCSLDCFRANSDHDDHDYQANPDGLPSRHDGVTMTCPVCQGPFTASGRRRFCSDACKATAYRRRRDANHPAVTLPKAQPRRPITVYECDNCGDRALAEQHCPACNTWMRRVGLGGSCPACDQPVTVNELLGQEVAP
jgi:hypothetical protein